MVPISMADFPPNLEDGELWLPSDVFLEIISTTNVSKVKNNNKNLLVHDHPTLKSSAYVAPEIQIGDTMGSVKPNGKNPIGKRVPSVNHGYHPCWSHGFQVVSGPFNTYDSKIMIPTHQTQGFKNRQAMFVYGKSQGTGVFLPHFKKSSLKENTGVLPRGTGVFLNHQVIDKYKYGDEKNGQGYEKKEFGNEETEENKRYEPRFTYDHQICLPQEWTYSAL